MYGFRLYRCLEIALYHTLGQLPEPDATHRFCWKTRFVEQPGGPFLREPDASRIPPLLELPRLLSAAERIVDDKDTDEDLRLLFAPGSSLGGARPKASVRLKDGTLAIAKFPRRDDEINVVAWEAVALTLARKAWIATPARPSQGCRRKACARRDAL